MDLAAFKKPAGYLLPTVFDERAFVPYPLPPKIDYGSIAKVLSEADQKLGELRGIGEYLPNPYLLIRPLQRKEAISSSNMEGTFTSLPELLMLEYGAEEFTKSVDTKEVYNYISALQKGINLLDEMPVSNRLLRNLHEELLKNLPKHRAGPFPLGEFRQEQNFIGKVKDIKKSRFNPPPPGEHVRCMSELEKFINSEDMHHIPTLVFLSLIHYQFETIHSFPDGNGRVGRLIIPLILHERKVMQQPLLYMSQFFEDKKDEYVDLMLGVSRNSAWISWVDFFLRGVIESSVNTIDKIKKVRDLQEQYKQRCQQARSSALLLQIVDSLFEKIAITIPSVKEMTGTSYTAAKNNVEKLVEYGILKDLGFRSRSKYYFAVELMQIFE